MLAMKTLQVPSNDLLCIIDVISSLARVNIYTYSNKFKTVFYTNWRKGIL